MKFALLKAKENSRARVCVLGGICHVTISLDTSHYRLLWLVYVCSPIYTALQSLELCTASSLIQYTLLWQCLSSDSIVTYSRQRRLIRS